MSFFNGVHALIMGTWLKFVFILALTIALAPGDLLLKIGTTVFMVRKKFLVYSQLDKNTDVF